MKHIILILLASLTLCAGTKGNNRITIASVIAYDSLGRKQTIVQKDTNINGSIVIDTLSVTTEIGNETNEQHDDKWNYQWGMNGDWDNVQESVVAITAIVLIFGMPVFIIFIIFYFRYKNRKAQYRLIEQSLACGQPLPENFYKRIKLNEDLRSKGIRKCCLGIGLFIFLHALTRTYGISCIGLIILINGIGELIIYYTRPKDRRNDIDSKPEAGKE